MPLIPGTWTLHGCQPPLFAGPGQPNTEVISTLTILTTTPDPQPPCIPFSMDLTGAIVPLVAGFNAVISGFWDEIAQKITFIGIDASGVTQIYTGFGFQVPPNNRLALASYFEAFPPAGAPPSPFGGYAERVLYGWYALPV